MKTFTTFILALLLAASQAQVTFIVDSLPDYTPPEDEVYIVGSFNGWNPGDAAYVMQKNGDDLWEITLDGFANGETIEYKFTRGDWESVEKGPNGEEIDNRAC